MRKMATAVSCAVRSSHADVLTRIARSILIIGLALMGAGCQSSKLQEEEYRQHWHETLAERRTVDQVLSPKALEYVEDLATNQFQCDLSREYLERRINFFMVPAKALEDLGPMRERPAAGGLVPRPQAQSKWARIFREVAFSGPDGQDRDYAIFISQERSRNDPRLIESIALHELIHLIKIRKGEPFRDETEMSFEQYKAEEREVFYYTYFYLKRYQGWEFEDWMGAFQGYRWQMMEPRWLKFYREGWESVR